MLLSGALIRFATDQRMLLVVAEALNRKHGPTVGQPYFGKHCRRCLLGLSTVVAAKFCGSIVGARLHYFHSGQHYVGFFI